MAKKEANAQEVQEAQVQKEQQVLTFQFSVDEANTILAGLDELPHKFSARIVQKIQEQAKSQLEG